MNVKSVMARLDCPMSFWGMPIHRCPISVGLLLHLGASLGVFLVPTTYANSIEYLGLHDVSPEL